MNKVVMANVVKKMALELIPGITKAEAFQIARRAVGK